MYLRKRSRLYPARFAGAIRAVSTCSPRQMTSENKPDGFRGLALGFSLVGGPPTRRQARGAPAASCAASCDPLGLHAASRSALQGESPPPAAACSRPPATEGLPPRRPRCQGPVPAPPAHRAVSAPGLEREGTPRPPLPSRTNWTRLVPPFVLNPFVLTTAVILYSWCRGGVPSHRSTRGPGSHRRYTHRERCIPTNLRRHKSQATQQAARRRRGARPRAGARSQRRSRQ